MAISGAEEQARFRQFRGAAGIVIKLWLALIPVIGTVWAVNVPSYLGVVFYKEQYLGLFLTFVLSSTFLITPPTKKALRDNLPWYDILLTILSLMVSGYITIRFPYLIPRMGYITATNMILSAITIVLVLEAGRRLFGWSVVIIGIIFILYGPYAYLFPGILHTRKILWGRVLTSLYLSPDALLGVPLAVAGIIVLGFIFFGQILFATGGGKFLTDIALALMGKYRGGPAKVAVVASALFGTISGSASANVATTGIITIPMMKRIGYRPEFAGAVEAVASTGGLIMPPVMAATAFIMAEFLEIPYAKIAISAFIPAILYYAAVFAQVHAEAVKEGLIGLPPQELPSIKRVMRQGWPFIIPPLVLVYCLFVLYLEPQTGAVAAVGATILIGLFRKETRRELGRMLTILENTGRALIEVGVICGLAGYIVGVVSLTGLGLSLSRALVALSGGNALMLLVLAAIGSTILGMGMPITACYILLVLLIAPALIQLGILPLAAHLFLMYFGAMSFVTPPVAIAAYVAAGIARADPMRVGFIGVRLGIVAYVVPFVFCYNPALLLKGSVEDIILLTSSVTLGIISIAIAFEGYLFYKLNVLKRIGFSLAGFLLIVPELITDGIGLLLGILLVLWEYQRRRVLKAVKEPSAMLATREDAEIPKHKDSSERQAD